MNSYLWLKALHVLSMAVWTGAALTLLGIAGIMARSTDRGRLAGLAAACDFAGTRLIAPAGGLTLVFGLVTMMVGHVGMPFWVLFGVVANLLLLVVGGAVLGRGFRRLATLLDAPGGNEAEITALLARIRFVGRLAVALLVFTAFVMVLKPVL
ncbi:MAG TPA: hypothetical protein VJU15_07400 [Gemmatimonadales bacterium]|nr:hypothetical protein [Gemmatimonadales bacterium]